MESRPQCRFFFPWLIPQQLHLPVIIDPEYHYEAIKR